MGLDSPVAQRDLFEPEEASERGESLNTSTFSDNLSLPIHRWFRYSAGFSALWVRELIDHQKRRGRLRVLDPFVGSGTVLLEAQGRGVNAMGIEAHPFVARIARAKLHWAENPAEFRGYALRILAEAKKRRGSTGRYASLIQKCFPTQALLRLDSIRRAWEDKADGSPQSELSWLALVSILRECSPVGTAQWQYVLPRKTKARVQDPLAAFETKAYLMADDMSILQSQRPEGQASLLADDARQCAQVPSGWADLVITSPPYTNNYDYADATRLEMTFFGEVSNWGDLQERVRRFIIRSCTQHVARLSSKTDEIICNPLLVPIRPGLSEVCAHLRRAREKHGGKKPYHTMIAAYFEDMAKVWHALRRVTHEDSQVCLVIGDSAPYGVYVPVEKWLGELALASGFRGFRFERTRARNIKWKNRKHRVPLQEGRLWVTG